MADEYGMTLELLRNQYPGRVLLGVQEVAKIFGVSPKTIQNSTHKKAKRRFPVQPVAALPGKKFRITDCARVLASGE